jgi:hypothetical protein
MYLYVFSAPSYGAHNIVKVGISKNPQQRLKSVRQTHDHLMKIVAIYDPIDARTCESKIKIRLKAYRRQGHECFAIKTQCVLDFIEEELVLKQCEVYYAK